MAKGVRAVRFGCNNNGFNVNGNNRIDNNNGISRRMTLVSKTFIMKRYGDLFEKLCSYENLELAFRKARKRKTLKSYVIEFEKNLKENLQMLRTELLLHCYRPKPLETFIVRDPKTRKISKSDFRDRIIHHALCNIIELIFEKSFIYDSYANRKCKGTLKALERFDHFKRKCSKNNTRSCYVLKADIKKYFENVHHETLIKTIQKKIKDRKVINLIRIILSNHRTNQHGKGMPLGNLTSQFFANVYLNELDYFIKQKLRIHYYIRYVDDFVIFSNSREKLETAKRNIDDFLKTIRLELHPDKSKIRPLNQGITLLGFRIFNHHKLIKKSNMANMKMRLSKLRALCDEGLADYDYIYSSMEGWLAYASKGDTYNLRCRFIQKFNEIFPNDIANIEISRWLKAVQT